MPAPVFSPGSISLRLYPHNQLPADQIVSTYRAQAAQAEANGFDGIMTSEHHGGFGGYLPNPLQAAGWCLEAMRAGWAAPCPLLLPLKPTALVIEEIAWLAARFPGRVGLGVAAGSLELDFTIMGQQKEGYRQRFAEALPVVTRVLAGHEAGDLKDDPAIRRLAQHPVKVLSASGSPLGCRRAAAAGAGLLFDSLTSLERSRELVGIYRDAGGTGPLVLIRRVWIGDRATVKERQDRQTALYRTYSEQSAQAYWAGDQTVSGSPAEVAEKLAVAQRDCAAESMNIRVHAPGMTPEEVRDQINGLGEVLKLLRR